MRITKEMNFLSKDKNIELKHFITYIFFIGLLFYIGLKDRFILHTLGEAFGVIIGFSMAIIAYNTYKLSTNDNLNYNFVLLGIIYGFVSVFQALHVFTQDIVKSSMNLSYQFAIVSYYLESIVFFIAFKIENKRIKDSKIFYGFFIVSILLYFSIVEWKVFPKGYVEGVGEGSFLFISRLIISVILLLAIRVLMKNKEMFNPKIYRMLLTSILFKILLHGLYIVEGNLVLYISGQILKVISVYLIYKALLEICLKNPYGKLIRIGDRYNKIFSLLPESVFIFKNNKIIYANDAAAKFVKVKDKEVLIGHGLEDFFTAHSDYDEIIRERSNLLQGSEASVDFLEQEIFFKDGSSLDAEIGGVSFYDQGSLLNVMVCRDISDRKKTERLKIEIEEEKIKLKQAIEHDNLKTQFFSTISHELKTPLNIILSAVQLMSLSFCKSAECSKSIKQKKYLDMIKQNCFRLLRLINNLIDITRIDANFLKMNYKPYNIVSVVEDITLSVGEYINNNNINLVFDTEVEEIITLCDGDKIERVMLNLLSNAVKFTEENGTIEVNLYDKKDTVVISIKDNGIGIPKEKLSDIFQRFGQVDSSLTRKKEGSGIGLSLVKALVELHGGVINVKSQMGKGSEFIIELPVRPVDNRALAYHEIATTVDEKVERISIEFSDIYS